MNNFNSLRLKYFPTTYLPLIMGMFCLLGSIQSFAQCPQSLGCNDKIQISLDYQCFAEITPELILEDERQNCDYMVTILTAQDVIIDQTEIDPMGGFDHPVIDGSYVGALYKASVSFQDDAGVTISCWGWFSVEDKLPPTVTCIDDFTVDCSRDLSELFTSTGLATYCSGPSPTDTDGDPTTISITLTPTTGSGSTDPWEVIDFIDINVPLTPTTGSGTGIIITGGGSFSFTEDPVDNSIYKGPISGVQASDQNLGASMTLVIANSPANQVAIAAGICIDFYTTSFYTFQQNDNCDPNVEVVINKDEIRAVECIDGITAQRDIEYFTRDDAGLSTDLCAFTILFEKKDLADIEFPSNSSFLCSDPQILTDGELDLNPENTGQPLLDGLPIDDGDNLCRINVTFSDDTFNLCGINTIKIQRRWTALDWCAGEYSQSYQTIKVQDLTAPSFDAPDGNIEFFTDDDCKATVILMPLSETDTTGVENLSDCSDLSHLIVEVEYLPGLVSDPENYNRSFLKAIKRSKGYEAVGLKHGENTIKYIFSDDCGNSSEKTFIITITDDAAPNAICDQFTAVSLADNGWGRIYAQSVDDGSYDDCGGPVELAIRKSETLCEGLPEYEGNDLQFGDFVQFCCQEGGLTIPVTLRVTDEGGEFSSCIVNVIVQDKTGIKFECPDQLTIFFDCSEAMDIDTSQTGSPYITDDCGLAVLRYEDSGSVDEICGDGTITRRWFVDLPNETISLTSCEQKFVFSNQVNLTINSFVWPQDRADATCLNIGTDLGDMVLYRDKNSNKNVPLKDANICAHLSASYKDIVFEDVSGYCLKVIRTWTVIDFCVYNIQTNPGQGIWSRSQVIKVSSIIGPELTSCASDTTFLVTNSQCEQNVSFKAPDAFDVCRQESIEKSDISYTITQGNQTVFAGFGDINNKVLGVGSFTVTWAVTGMCSVVSTCSFDITVEDGKAPVPYCRSGISTSIPPPPNGNSEPSLTLWANDFDLGTSDNCDDNVSVSFDENNQNSTSITFTCEDLGPQTLQVWFTDDAGNKDFCVTTINIQANSVVCPEVQNGGGIMVAGKVVTEFNENIENVNVGLQSMIDLSMAYDKTNINGEFVFHNNDNYLDYKLNGVSNDDYLNGVSTLDLVIIQRHILGLQTLTSPYQIVAADINNSQDISAIDLIVLRKLILGIYNELPDNESWRYIDGNQVFSDILYPWPLSESIDIYDLSANQMSNDFIGVKVGDVNNSVNLLKNDTDIESRTINGSVTLTHDILELNQTNEYLIPFYFDSEQSLMGLQLSLNFDNNLVTIVDVESGKIDLDQNSYDITDGQIKMSWYNEKAKMSSKEDALFYITIRTTRSMNDDVFKISSHGLRSEIYNQNLEVLNVNIERKSFDYKNKLFQNVPNPFSAVTTIDFELERDSKATLTIYGTNGKVVKVVENNFRKGTNSILIDNNDLYGNGIYYYQLDTEYFSSTRKMILIE